MNIIKRVKNDNYTAISNVFLRDDKLSLKAKGLLATVLSLPDSWDFSINGICAIVKEGKTAMYSTIDELKALGYCSVVPLRDEKGRLAGNDYVFYEEPYMENPHVDVQPQIKKDGNNNNSLLFTDDIINNNQEKKNPQKKEKDELFDECWIAYRRKGSKKKALEYWNKLKDDEKSKVLRHVKAYVSAKELQYQKDFERYLRDKVFTTIVFNGNMVVYDPTKSDGSETAYIPDQNWLLSWNDVYKCYLYIGDFSDGKLFDGYDDDNRPDGATIMLNNARGTVVWSREQKKWIKQ